MNNSLYVNGQELRKSIIKINEILQNNTKIEGKISNIFSDLKKDVTVNYKAIDNKEDMVNYNIKIFKANCEQSTRVLDKTIVMYETAQQNAVNYINKQAGEIR